VQESIILGECLRSGDHLPKSTPYQQSEKIAD
jgi:hypothetical protein